MSLRDGYRTFLAHYNNSDCCFVQIHRTKATMHYTAEAMQACLMIETGNRMLCPQLVYIRPNNPGTG